MKKLLTLLLALVTTGLWATDFDDWDIDGDGMVEKHEFKMMFVREYFEPIHGNSTNGINEENYFKGMFSALDKDDNRLLSDQEWLIGYNYYFQDYVIYEQADMIDINMDGSIDYDEFYDVVYDTSYFADVDMDNDNYITEHELAEFIFNIYDQNRSGILTKSEFEMFRKYFLEV